MKDSYFKHNGITYGIGTIAKVYDNQMKNLKFSSMIKFVGYDSKDKLYYFVSIYDQWKKHGLTIENIELYIEKIVTPCYLDYIQKNESVDYDNIDGIASMVTWYAIIMIGAVIFKHRIVIWMLTSFIFFKWLQEKRNGR